MNAKAIISSLPYKIKSDVKAEIYRTYMAKNIRLIGENTAKLAEGEYMFAEYSDIINPKPVIKHKKGEITAKIKSKFKD